MVPGEYLLFRDGQFLGLVRGKELIQSECLQDGDYIYFLIDNTPSWARLMDLKSWNWVYPRTEHLPAVLQAHALIHT